MTTINEIQHFLKEYNELITIVILGILIPIFIFICKKIKSYFKRLDIKFSLSSSIINSNNCFSEVKLINHTDEVFTVSSLDVVLFDNKKKYVLSLSKDPFKLDAGDTKIINIKPVSYYCLSGEFVDISNLFFSQQMYFMLNPSRKKFFVQKWYKALLHRIKLPFMKKKELSVMNFQFQEVAHSLNWEYGFVYKYNGSSLKVGFFEKQIVSCPDFTINKQKDDFFTPDLVYSILIANGMTDIQMRKLEPSMKIEPTKLGSQPKLKTTIKTKDGIPIITIEDTKDFTQTENV